MSGWTDVALGDICELKYGRSLPENNRRPGDVPVFGSNGQVGIHDDALTISETIIVGRKGSYGEVNFSVRPCWPIDTTYYIDRTATKADIRWLSYRLRALRLNELNRAAAVPGLNREDAYRKRLLLPPVVDQRRIADILGKMDALQAKRRAALAQLDTLSQAIFLEMFGNPANNSKGWPLTTLGDLVCQVSDGPHVSPSYASDGVPFLSTRHVRAGEILWDDLKFITEEDAVVHWKKCRPSRGDIIYTKGGTTGLAATVATDRPFAIWVHLALLKPDHAKVHSTWLEAMLNTPYCYRQSQQLTRGIANRDLGLTRMVRIKLFRPPLSEQYTFAQRVAVIQKLKESYRSSLGQLDALFASLQHRAFRGEL